MGALMVMEVSRKQHYIFKSRKLKDHIGASAIIRYITEDLFEQKNDLNLSSFSGKLIFKGGGKSLFYFDSLEKAKCFVRAYSTHVLQEYPGVELFMSCVPHDQEKDYVLNSIDTLFEKLSIKKSRRDHGFYQVDYGVNKVCKESKMPANHFSYKGRNNVSDEIAEKIEFALKMESGDKEVDFFNQLLPQGSKYKNQLQDNIDSEKNIVAVVHIDGNSMGQRVLAIKQRYEKLDKNSNQIYLEELNNFSKSVDEAYIYAFKEMLKIFKHNLFKDNTTSSEGLVELPIRPLILAGDDICFITEGQYGIECSRIFLEKLYEKTDSSGDKLRACAGVAIVKSKYPFFKAYELSEQLCSNAKRTLAVHKVEGSAIDWHVSFGEINNSITEIRENEYVTDEDQSVKLYQRPYVLSSTVSKDTSISNYEMFMDSKKIIDLVAKTSRNTIKSLRNALKTGENATKDYFQIYRIVQDKMKESEFVGGASRSFDAIEVMDFFKVMEE